MLNVTAAIIRRDDGRILICRRGEGGDCPFKWEFPGGKIESGESARDCIIRECAEELDIDIAVVGIFAETQYAYPSRTISFTFFEARILSGEPRMKVHSGLIWALPQELASIDFAPADRIIADKLV